VLPLEIQYVIRQHRDGREYLTAEQALALKAEKRSKPIPQNPIRIARLYLCERKSDPPKSYAAIAKRYGVSRAEVCYHIALVKRLPREFVDWLGQCEDQDALRVFTERRLRPVAKLKSPEEQRLRLQRFQHAAAGSAAAGSA